MTISMAELVLLCLLTAALIRAPREEGTPKGALTMIYLLTIGVLLFLLLTRLAR